MKSIHTHFLVALSFLFCYACSEDDNNTVTPPSNVNQALLETVISNLVEVQYSKELSIDIGVNWAQHIDKVQYNDHYDYREMVSQNIWDILYQNKQYTEELIQLGAATQNNNLQAVAKVLQAYNYSLLTDLFGAVPFDVGQSFEYQSQEMIYLEIIALLDDANQLFSIATGTIDGVYDNLYQGNLSKWEQFGNAIHLRLLLRTSGQWEVSSAIQNLVNENTMFQSNADNAAYVFSGIGDDVHPLHRTIVTLDRIEYRGSTFVFDLLEQGEDPRAATMLSVEGTGNQLAIGEICYEPTSPANFMTYAEQCFLLAEAAYKGYVSLDIGTFYNQGVIASFQSNGLEVATAENFLNTYPLQQTEALEQIAIQKYLATYLQGFEAWTEYRRTGYPVMTVPSDAHINEIPSRLLYPSSQAIENTANYNNAISMQGEDVLTTKLWWQL